MMDEPARVTALKAKLAAAQSTPGHETRAREIRAELIRITAPPIEPTSTAIVRGAE